MDNFKELADNFNIIQDKAALQILLESLSKLGYNDVPDNFDEHMQILLGIANMDSYILRAMGIVREDMQTNPNAKDNVEYYMYLFIFAVNMATIIRDLVNTVLAETKILGPNVGKVFMDSTSCLYFTDNTIALADELVKSLKLEETFPHQE